MDCLTISCDDCCMRFTPACDGCVVSFIIGGDPEHTVVIDAGEEQVIRMLGRSGLVPPLRHRRRPAPFGAARTSV